MLTGALLDLFCELIAAVNGGLYAVNNQLHIKSKVATNQHMKAITLECKLNSISCIS